MEKIKAHFRKITCEICKNKLFSVYVRSGKSFKSLEDYYFCSNCSKIFKLELNSKVFKEVSN